MILTKLKSITNLNNVQAIQKCYFSIKSINYSSNQYVEIKDKNLNGLVRRIIMINDKQRNTLSLDAIKHIKNAVKSTDINKYRVIIISADKRSVFSSGHNLKELTNVKNSAIHEQVFQEMSNLCSILRESPLPTIAEVYGLAAAAGCQLAASCDLIIASDKASFSTPGVKFGIFCSTPGVSVSRNVNSKLAMKMLLTGDAINAEEALKYGLVSEVVAGDKLEERVDEIAQKINSNSKPIIALGKKCFYKQIEQSNINDAYKIAEETMLDNLKYEDTQNGFKSFAEKKKPIWSHSENKLDA